MRLLFGIMKNPIPMLDVLSQPAARRFERLIRHRRATPHFRDEPVPNEVLDAALSLAAEAPSGFNFQPWRFLVLRSAEQREALRGAAMGQEKIAEAPVVIVALAEREKWKNNIDEILHTKARHNGDSTDDIEVTRSKALAFINKQDPAVWLTRQTMIAFTYLMLAVESLGWDTAPMEGFDAAQVRAALELPDEVEVIALLAIGRATDASTFHPGRLSIDQIAYNDNYGNHWPRPTLPAGNPAHQPGDDSEQD